MSRTRIYVAIMTRTIACPLLNMQLNIYNIIESKQAEAKSQLPESPLQQMRQNQPYSARLQMTRIMERKSRGIRTAFADANTDLKNATTLFPTSLRLLGRRILRSAQRLTAF